VAELATLREKGEMPFLLDVRRGYEAEIATMGADQLIPVEELENRLSEVRAPKEARFVVHCKVGGRSARAVRILRQNGWTGAINLAGGITAWANEVDPEVPTY
jgi:sulfur-carrier protein adenylyltransferase/sulfurtransferase